MSAPPVATLGMHQKNQRTNIAASVGFPPAADHFFSVITVFSGFLRAEKAEQPTTRTAASGRPEIAIPCAWPSPVSPSYQPISQLQRLAMTRPPRLRHMLKPQILTRLCAISCGWPAWQKSKNSYADIQKMNAKHADSTARLHRQPTTRSPQRFVHPGSICVFCVHLLNICVKFLLHPRRQPMPAVALTPRRRAPRNPDPPNPNRQNTGRCRATPPPQPWSFFTVGGIAGTTCYCEARSAEAISCLTSRVTLVTQEIASALRASR